MGNVELQNGLYGGGIVPRGDAPADLMAIEPKIFRRRNRAEVSNMAAIIADARAETIAAWQRR